MAASAGLIVDPNRYATPQQQTPQQQQQQQPGSALNALQQALMQPQPGIANYGTTYDQAGQTTTYQPYPNVATNQYGTTPTTFTPQQTIGVGEGTKTLPASTSGGTQVTGQGTLSPQAYEQQQQSQLEAMLANQSFAYRLGLMQPYTGAGAGHVDWQTSAGNQEDAARAAAFARAKDLAGKNAMAGFQSLRNAFDQAGLTGSNGPELMSGAMGNLMGLTGNSVNEFIREQLMQDLNHSADVAKTRYGGDITQRGQDLQRQQSILGLLSAGRLY